MVICTTHATAFPDGWEDEHRAGPTGEQNSAGTCQFDYSDAGREI